MTLAVDRYELGIARTNCYVVRAERGAPAAVVIDPGDDAVTLRLELARAGATCAAILVTHGDVDHVGAVAELADGDRRTRVRAAAGAHAGRARGGCRLVLRPRVTVDHELDGGESLDLAGITFDVLAIPGHSPDHVAFASEGALFSGDLVFAGSVGRVDLPGGDWEALLESARALGDRFARETTIYPGHGPLTTLGEELDRNPFLAELRT